MTSWSVFPDPIDQPVTATHDTAGWTIQSHAGTHPGNGAACQVLEIPDGTPDANGVTLITPGEKSELRYHGILYLHLPTGAGMVIDVFPKVPASTTVTLPTLQIVGKYFRVPE